MIYFINAILKKSFKKWVASNNGADEGQWDGDGVGLSRSWVKI